MILNIGKLTLQDGIWVPAENWIYYHHSDQTCSVYFPYSGTIFALAESSAWVLSKIQESPRTTEQLVYALQEEIGDMSEGEVASFFDDAFACLVEETNLISLVPDA